MTGVRTGFRASAWVGSFLATPNQAIKGSGAPVLLTGTGFLPGGAVSITKGPWNDVSLTADATGIPVEAGPVEATVAGNILSQAYAMGELASAEEVRAVVRRSATLTEYQPREAERWNDRYAAYCRLQENIYANK
jgi:hypothetical protein